MNIQEMIAEKSRELAKKHAEIIENECRMVCNKFNCLPEALIIEYHQDLKIKIKIDASTFEIKNQFICDGKVIK